VPVDRPTFSESWYRVAELRPRLRSTVQVLRQHYRGRMWHVLQDPSSNQFFRLNEAAYRFVALLDGTKNVAEVWRICSDQLGDSAPTQGEAIQLLGQLYTSNLLYADLPPDAAGLFKRYRKRVTREIQGYLMNLLFIRIPLIDPDNFLNAWVGAVSWLFTWFGFLLWLGLLGTGLYFVLQNWSELSNRADSVLNVENLPFLYLSFVIIKVVHEFGHAFICKVFGKRTGTGGEVHVMGVMFLVFTPMPYVDASSAWAFRSRLQRILVGMGGMIVELGVAAIAAVIWASIGAGTLRTICYNAMFIASVSTILFNANPLLRYDGYYVLSDLLEIPNLAQRSKQYLYYLVKKYIWNVRQARDPAHSRGEKVWFVAYGISSTIYRVLICVNILLFVADKLFMLGAILALAAAVAWVFVPLGKFAHYLATSGELSRVRPRAVATTVVTLAALVVGVALVPAPDRFRVEGIVEPAQLQIVHAETDGFVTSVMPSGGNVEPNGTAMVVAVSPDLVAKRDQLLAERRRLTAQRRLAQTKDQAAAQILAEQLNTTEERIERVNQQCRLLEVHASFPGQWIAPEIDRAKGAFLHRGDKIGMVASSDVVIRATAPQEDVDLLLASPKDQYVLYAPAEALEALQAEKQAADQAHPLTGSLLTAEHPDMPMLFTVEQIEPAATQGPVGTAAQSGQTSQTRPASTGPAGDQPASRPAKTQATSMALAATATAPAAAAATGPTTRPERKATVPVHIRMRDVWRVPPISGKARAHIGQQDLGEVLATRNVRWRRTVELRIKARPDPQMTGTIDQIIEAGKDQLPSAALGYGSGGPIQTDPKDQKGVKTAERFFEIRIVPDPVDNPGNVWHGRMPLLSGQRVVVRVEMPSRPLVYQWYRSLVQLVQRRFQI
jgi:putative peptide zinc metalloprotease protein